VECAIIVVAYRSAADLPGLLASVPAAAGGMSWHAIVVDNDGTDGLTGALAGAKGTTLIASPGNIGYSGGLNLGMAAAPPSRVTVFLNPDLTLEPGSLAALVAAVDDQRVGAAVPRIRDDTGETQPSLRREPTVLRSAGEALFGDHWPGRPRWFAEMVREPERYERSGPVDWATGAALAVPTEMLRELGPWDAERFFLYSEETDYFRRVRAADSLVQYVPGAVVRHAQGGSGRSPQLDALQTVNKLRYYRKWHRALPSAAFAATLALHNLLRLGEPSARASLAALFSRAARNALPGGPVPIRQRVAEEVAHE
jgi:N-acetylglucosaminyl-diphospho-decaprenol L-rhamnosyltransferase